MAYKGKYTPKNVEKYVGNHENVVYRSLWERNTFRWLDSNDSIVAWNSEEIVIPYLCKTDNAIHRYHVDIWFKTKENKTYLIEIKPKKQMSPPKTPKRKDQKYLTEQLIFVKNQCKWKAAKEFALDNGWEFQVWNEDTLRSLGIKV